MTASVDAAFPETEDEELRQLAHVYQPVLWAPDKAEAAQRCWQHYAADRPGVVHDDRLAKEASSEKNAIVRQVRPGAAWLPVPAQQAVR